MGKQERAKFKAELEKLGKIAERDGEETDEFLAQNRRVADAEKRVGLAENLWVRGQVG
jgi:hypothetical protein